MPLFEMYFLVNALGLLALANMADVIKDLREEDDSVVKIAL